MLVIHFDFDPDYFPIYLYSQYIQINHLIAFQKSYNSYLYDRITPYNILV